MSSAKKNSVEVQTHERRAFATDSHIVSENVGKLFGVMHLLFDAIRQYSKFRRFPNRDEWIDEAVLVQVRLGRIEDILNPFRLEFDDPRRYRFHEVFNYKGCLKELRMCLDDIITELRLRELAHTRPTNKPLWDRQSPPPQVPGSLLLELREATQQLAKEYGMEVSWLPSEKAIQKWIDVEGIDPTTSEGKAEASQIRQATKAHEGQASELPPAEKSKIATSLKIPKGWEVKAYRLWVLKGWRQEDIEAVVGKTQGSISRAKVKVEAWIKAGNVLPELPETNIKQDTVDPAVLDKGARQDNRTPRQRDKRSSSG